MSKDKDDRNDHSHFTYRISAGLETLLVGIAIGAVSTALWFGLLYLFFG